MATVLDPRRPATRRNVLGIAALVLMVGILLSWSVGPRVVTTGTGDQLATPANELSDDHTWGATGCTIPGAAMDSVPGLFDFAHACTHHDGCYQGLDRHGNPAVIDRARCDQLFRADLEASCAVLHGGATDWRAKECLNTAETYYDVVRSFGAPYYEGTGARA